jgi:SAM-dependent methyltransferase
LDLPRSFTIRESSHRIINPLTPEKLATLGRAIHLRPGMSALDLACGKGEMLGTWARDYGLTGTGVDISTEFLAAARNRVAELGVADRVDFVHADASAYVAAEPVDLAMCIGATWIGGGSTGTVDLLERSLRPGGMVLIGEIFWRVEPPDEATAQLVLGPNPHEVRSLPGLVEALHGHGWDLVEMMLADQDSWDRYVAPQWLNVRTWLDANPDDELADQLRAELRTSPVHHTRYQREYLGWGVFALMKALKR